MIEASILGGLLGGITRMVPEVMSFMDKKNERKHELAMLAASVEADKVRGELEMAKIDQKIEGEQFAAALSTLQTSVASQAAKSGNAIMDGINVLVRPMITYIVFFMWVMVKFVALYNYTGDLGLEKAINVWWGPEDQAMLAAILNFWFLGRVFDKVLKK